MIGMYNHFNNIREMYGNKAYVQIPNGIFKDLSQNIKKNNKTSIQQVSFAYTYLVTIAFLYKYAHFVDVDNGTYIQNGDIKELLGYGKTTKTVDKIIKKNGILEQIGLVKTTKDYPVGVEYTDSKINNINIRDFVMVSTLEANNDHYNTIKSIVKNNNYEIKEPTFLFEYDGDIGSLYNYEKTHKITFNEFMLFIYDDELDNIDFLMYSFFKYKCYGLKDNTKSIALYKIVAELGIGRDAFYTHLEKLKERGFVKVIHKGWRIAGEKHDSSIEANEYHFKGIL